MFLTVLLLAVLLNIATVRGSLADGRRRAVAAT
jgi:hypothetical protein